jgi:hypothetical protein
MTRKLSSAQIAGLRVIAASRRAAVVTTRTTDPDAADKVHHACVASRTAGSLVRAGLAQTFPAPLTVSCADAIKLTDAGRLVIELAQHDWHHAMSDAHNVWAAGHAHRKLIERLLAQVEPDVGRAWWCAYAPRSFIRDPYASGALRPDAVPDQPVHAVDCDLDEDCTCRAEEKAECRRRGWWRRDNPKGPGHIPCDAAHAEAREDLNRLETFQRKGRDCEYKPRRGGPGGRP